VDLHNTKFSLSYYEGMFTLSSTYGIKCPNDGTAQTCR